METATPILQELNCRLSVKSGEPLTPCRDKVPGHDFVFMVAHGYDVLLGHIKRVFDATTGLTWQEPVVAYVKPTNHAPQKDYVLVPSDSSEMEALFSTIWHMARLRKHGHAAFVLMLFVYVSRPRVQRLTSLRRATDNRIQEQLPRVAAFMSEHGIEGGAATQRYAAVSQARLPDDALVQVSENTTIRQLQFFDSQESAMQQDLADQQHTADDAYRLIRVCVHGVPIPMFINVSDLREALGLPPYSLRPPFRAAQQLDSPDPAVDIPDVDHGETN